ncbi:MAG: hypothetical protein IK098_03080 [Bacteroidales bacterium]|nr:hypothetical protein [Bacteroidales bacterium]
MRDLKDITPIKVGTILGYECYIPDTYYTPISCLNKGCPLWIKTDDEGNCVVMEIVRGNAFEEIADFIKRNLTIRKGYYYKRVIAPSVLPISCQILNENDFVCAEIIVSDDYRIKSLRLGNSEENDWLQSYFLSDYNIRGFNAKVLRIDKGVIDKCKTILKVLYDEDGGFVQLG